MKRFVLSLAATTLLLLMSAAAWAMPQDFVIINDTGYRIDILYISAVTSSSWEGDILGNLYFENGESFNIRFDQRETQCQWDMKVQDEDGDTWEMRDFNACNISEVRIVFRNNRFEFVTR